MTKITKDMTIGEIIRVCPQSIEPLLNAGMHCLGCPGSQMETLEQAAYVHGMNLDELLASINAVAE
ncbi:MAG: DUF1858 domain-containing protein [Eubacteriales bacterium]|nr:DUF1858 domain-containing protein [Eubacteriales bacterium]